ncbi:DUF420 domain-containing protein [candidate division KSB1 bacterium]|nr:DUF420 domain-containing protein [candidate division KSB1 bacterium]RQW00482.1 MAG: DUF420 domain-containing protein [candidate division KSB1 bacterium]
MNTPLHPTLNAILNFCAMILLVLGFVNIKKRKIPDHKKFMLAALVISLLFLASYLYYHYHSGSTPYPHYDWTRILYFSILLPHIILAAVQTPFILYIVWQAWKGNFARHKKIAWWIWPVWMFVSISGVVVYLMLYQF